MAGRWGGHCFPSPRLPAGHLPVARAHQGDTVVHHSCVRGLVTPCGTGVSPSAPLLGPRVGLGASFQLQWGSGSPPAPFVLHHTCPFGEGLLHLPGDAEETEDLGICHPEPPAALRSPVLVPADPRLCWWAAGAGGPLQGSVATLGHCRSWGLLAEAGSVPAVQAAPCSFPRSLCSPLPATAGCQAPLPEVSAWPPGGHGLEAPREVVPAPAALFAPLGCSLSGFLHPPSPLKLSEASAMGLGAARPGTKAALQGKNWSPSELGNVPGKREVSFSWRSDTESRDAPGGGWLWEGKQGMVIIGIPLQLQAALWVHPVRRGAVGTQMGRDAG